MKQTPYTASQYWYMWPIVAASLLGTLSGRALALWVPESFAMGTAIGVCYTLFWYRAIRLHGRSQAAPTSIGVGLMAGVIVGMVNFLWA